jgi:hypothetical protein
MTMLLSVHKSPLGHDTIPKGCYGAKAGESSGNVVVRNRTGARNLFRCDPVPRVFPERDWESLLESINASVSSDNL